MIDLLFTIVPSFFFTYNNWHFSVSKVPFCPFLYSRPFQHIQNLCLFLFNDALMVTVEAKKHIPYTREVTSILKFQAAVSLTKVHVEDVPDTRCKWSSQVLTREEGALLCQFVPPKMNFILALQGLNNCRSYRTYFLCDIVTKECRLLVGFLLELFVML